MPANARHRHTAHPPDLAALLSSRELALRSERKRPSIIEQYTIGVRLFLRWCHANYYTPAIDQTLVEGFVADLLADGIAPPTVVLRQQCLRQFAKWLVEEGELARPVRATDGRRDRSLLARAGVTGWRRARRRGWGSAARNISYHGLRNAILRAVSWPVSRALLHQLRHTAATRSLPAGGSEGGAMSLLGWRNRNMLDRYITASANERAATRRGV